MSADETSRVPEPSALRWYAVHTKAREEWLAASHLRRQGIETLLLHRLVERRHAGRVAVRRAPEFPRYLFVRCGDGGVAAANRTPGVSTVVYGVGGPLVVPDAVIAELRSRGDATGEIGTETPEPRRRMRPGERVSIVDGPLAGLLATVALDAGPQVRVWLQMFGGRVDALIEPRHLTAGLST